LGIVFEELIAGADGDVTVWEKEGGVKKLMATKAMSIMLNFLLLMNLRLVQSS
jgi:hypothetical protein